MSRVGRQIAYQETTTTKNEKTGETTETSTTKQFKAEVEPSYIKLYLEDIAYLYNLPSNTPQIVFELLQFVDYNQEIILTKRRKEQIAKTLDKSLSHINNSITTLTKSEVLIKIDRQTYQLNTYLFGKGSWKDILKHRKSLQLEIFYSYKEGRTVKQKDI